MDGSGRRSIVTGSLVWPNGLTVDHTTNRLFWADAKLDTIEMSDLDGGNRQVILSSAADIHPFGLALYQNVLYWTDWDKQSILSLNLTNSSQQVVVTGLLKPMDIHVFDSSFDLGTKWFYLFFFLGGGGAARRKKSTFVKELCELHKKSLFNKFLLY